MTAPSTPPTATPGADETAGRGRTALSQDTVPAVLARRVAASPDAIAFQTEAAPGRWAPVTWADFAARVERLRRGLHAAGLRPGDRLVIIAPVSLEWELLHHAAMALGAVVAGMDGHDLPTRIAGMVELADITAFAVADPAILAQVGPPRWARCRLAVQLGPAAEGWPAGASPVALEALEALGADAPAPDLPGPCPQDDATIIFTSGTTGDPKGIAYRHEQVCLAIETIAEAYPFVGPGSRLLCWLPLSNLFQRIVNLAGMRSGAASYLLGDPRRVMDVVAGVAPDVFVGVPRFYEKLYEGVRQRVAALPPWQRLLVGWAWETGRRSSPFRQRREPMPPGLRLRWALADRLVLTRVRAVMGDRLRCMVTGSAPTPTHLLEEFHALGWLLLEAYGMSENVVPIAMNRVDRYRLGTVGCATGSTAVSIDTEGRLTVRGPGLFSGYLGADAPKDVDTQRAYTSTDLASIDTNGFVTLLGRTSEIIKTSTGRRVSPVPIEALIREVPGVDQVAVIGNGRKRLAAVVTTSTEISEGDPAWEAIEIEVRARLARLAPGDRPGVVVLANRPLSIARGELTPNLKLRRPQVEASFREILDRGYARLDQGGASDCEDPVLLGWEEREPS